MKFLEARFRKPDRRLHPMEAFIRHEDVVRYEELRTWNLLRGEEIEYELFYVEATDVDRYREAVESVDSIREYNLTRIDDRSFYVYVCHETRETDAAFRRAFAALNLVVVPPIRYDDEAAMSVTVVGDGEDLGALLEGMPDEIESEVLEIGEFDRRHGALAGALTDRQFEAVAAAVDRGFYDVPRTGTLEDVAVELDCAPSTASNHLQKAEAAVMRRLVRRSGR